MSETKWRECNDPGVLAAAVAAGVEVRGGVTPTWPSGMRRARDFAECIEAGTQYHIPAGWSPDVPPADDMRERRVWTCKIGGRVGRLPAGADLPMRRAVADAFTAETGHPVEFCFSGWGDDLDESELAVVENREPDPEVIRAALVKRLTTLPGGSPTPAPPVPPWPGDENDDTARLSPDQGDRIVNACCRMLGCEPADIDGDAALEEILTEAVERCADLHGQDRWEDDCHGCGFRVGDHTTDGRCPAPAAPVPPWPGAVLSGLVDEDGEPTWLAQAGQVRGEQVRSWHGSGWVAATHSRYAWVEVRAPRPAAATERVQAWEAVRDGRQVVGASSPFEAHYIWRSGPERAFIGERTMDKAVLVAPDGTVEVLRDGAR